MLTVTRVLGVLSLALAVALAATATARAAPLIVGDTGGGIFRFPQAVAYDSSGVPDPRPSAPPPPYVYIADEYSFLVQKFTADGRFVREWGGYGSEPGRFGRTGASVVTTTGRVGGIGGVAVDSNGRVYVLDSRNDRIQLFSRGGRFRRAWGTTGSAPGELNTGINGGIAVFDRLLYLADQDNHRVQRFRLAGDGTPIGPPLVWGGFGAGEGQFDHPQGIAVDPRGEHDVFVADDRNHRVQRFSADGTFEAAVGAFGEAAGQFRFPYDVGVDWSGRLFVADNNNHRIQRFDAQTLAWQLAFGERGVEPGQLGYPRSLSALSTAPRGEVYVGNTSADRVDRFDGDGQRIDGWGSSGRGPGRFTLPRGVAVDVQGRLLVLDTRTDRVQRFAADGTFLDAFGNVSTLGLPLEGEGPGEYQDPGGLAVERATGDVWVADSANHRVQRLTAEFAHRETYGGPAGGDQIGRFSRPLDVALGPSGELLVADTGNDRIQRRDPATGEWTILPGDFRIPAAVDMTSEGRVAIAEAGADRVRVLTSDGGEIAVLDGLQAPEGVAGGPDGRIVVSDTGHHQVRIYVRSGDGYRLAQVLGRRGAAPGEFVLPTGVHVDPAGALLVADTYNHRVQRFPPAAR